MRAFKLIFAAYIFISILPPSALAADHLVVTERKMAGVITGHTATTRYLSVGEIVSVSIDSKYLVKGDYLDIFEASGEFGLFENRGKILITSPSDKPATGVIVSASREIGRSAFVDFHLADDRQVDLFLPFLQSLADFYHLAPDKGPLPIAILDVITPEGDRTAAGDAILSKLISSVCRRGQFACQNRSLVAHRLWREQVNTSRSVNAYSENNALKPLGIALYITGHLSKTSTGVDLVLMAHSISDNGAPKKMGQRFFFSLEKLGITLSMMDRVTLPYTTLSRGRLMIQLTYNRAVEGFKAEYVSYKVLDSEGEPARIDGAKFKPGRFFVTVDGTPAPLDLGGRFFDDKLPSGRHSIEAGFYLEEFLPGGSKRILSEPLFVRFDVDISADETTLVTLNGVVDGGVAAMVADLDWLKEKDKGASGEAAGN